MDGPQNADCNKKKTSDVEQIPLFILFRKSLVGNGHPEFTYQMTVDGLPIDLDTTHTEKDLGVYVDDKLKFDFHIHTAVTRANRMLGLINRSYTFLDKESILCLYKAMVHPILEYGVTVWSPYRKGDIDAVESVHRRATRILPELRGLDLTMRPVFVP